MNLGVKYKNFHSKERAIVKFEIHFMYEIKAKSKALLPRKLTISELILGLHPANERRPYKVTPSLIGWVQT